MLSDDDIRRMVDAGEVLLTRHASEQMVSRNIALDAIVSAGRACEVIEDYPNDKYAPSCLLLGFAAGDRPLHLHVSRAASDRAIIITVYEPDPAKWTDHRVRKDRS